MLPNDTQANQAVSIIVDAEEDLGRLLSFGERKDLLLDNCSWIYDSKEA